MKKAVLRKLLQERENELVKENVIEEKEEIKEEVKEKKENIGKKKTKKGE